jgi:hypothetical protein
VDAWVYEGLVLLKETGVQDCLLLLQHRIFGIILPLREEFSLFGLDSSLRENHACLDTFWPTRDGLFGRRTFGFLDRVATAEGWLYMAEHQGGQGFRSLHSSQMNIGTG